MAARKFQFSRRPERPRGFARVDGFCRPACDLIRLALCSLSLSGRKKSPSTPVLGQRLRHVRARSKLIWTRISMVGCHLATVYTDHAAAGWSESDRSQSDAFDTSGGLQRAIAWDGR